MRESKGLVLLARAKVNKLVESEEVFEIREIREKCLKILSDCENLLSELQDDALISNSDKNYFFHIIKLNRAQLMKAFRKYRLSLTKDKRISFRRVEEKSPDSNKSLKASWTQSVNSLGEASPISLNNTFRALSTSNFFRNETPPTNPNRSIKALSNSNFFRNESSPVTSNRSLKMQGSLNNSKGEASPDTSKSRLKASSSSNIFKSEISPVTSNRSLKMQGSSNLSK